jgi:hypothetical protein
MSQRINIMLPKETLGKKSLRERLKAGYLANAGENLNIAAVWFPLEEEATAPESAFSRRRGAESHSAGPKGAPPTPRDALRR